MRYTTVHELNVGLRQHVAAGPIAANMADTQAVHWGVGFKQCVGSSFWQKEPLFCPCPCQPLA